MGSKIVHHEELECEALMQWARLTRFATDDDPPIAGLISDYLFMIPNGQALAGSAKNRAAKMARMKKQGFRPGAADYFLAIPCGGFAGCWVEMKKTLQTFKNMGEAERSVSAVQEDFLDQMTDAGYVSVVAFGWEAAREAITEYLEGSIVEGSEVIVKPLIH